MLDSGSPVSSELALEPQDREAVNSGLLWVLFKRQRFASATAFLGFGFLGWLIRDAVPIGFLGAWMASLVLLDLLNLKLLGQLRRTLDDTRRRRYWLRGLTMQFFVYGVAWGSAPILPGLLHHPLLLQVILLGTAAVAFFSIHNLSTYRPMLFSFSMGIATPLWVMGMLSVADETQGLWAQCAVVMVAFIQLYGLSSYQLHRHDIEGSVMSRKLSQKLRESNQALSVALKQTQALATQDPLTQCLNRRALMDALQDEALCMQRYPAQVGVVIFDLDHFKSINDTHGHGVGDAVLVATVKRVRARLRESDLLARWGGEEFVCVLRHVQQDSLMAKARELCTDLAATPLLQEPLALTVTASFGVALWMQGESAESCIHRADEALYRAKRSGRNRVSQ